MKNNAIKAILFDRDGVLIDSEWVNIEAGKQAFLALGIDISEEDTQHIVGRPPKSYIGHFREKYSFDEDVFGAIQAKIYYELFAQAPLFDGAVHLVKTLKNNGYLVGLVTGSNTYSTDIFLKKAKLTEAFDTIITLEMYQRTKPDPESYLLAMKKIGLPKENFLAIEDSQRGLEAAKNAGITCIVIPNEQTKQHDFSGADCIVNSANDITFDLLSTL